MTGRFELKGYDGERFSAEQWCYNLYNNHGFDAELQIRKCVNEETEEVVSCQKIPYNSTNKYKQSLAQLNPDDKLKLYFNDKSQEELTKTAFFQRANDGNTIPPHWIALDIDFNHNPIDLTDDNNALFGVLKKFDKENMNYILFCTEEGRGIKMVFPFKDLLNNEDEDLKRNIGEHLISIIGDEYKPEIKISGNQCSFCYPAIEGDEPIHPKTNKPIKILHFKGFDNSLKEIQERISKDGERNTLEGYIWDEKEVIKNKIFPMDVYDENFFYGLLLPKIINKIDKDGDINGQMQIQSRCLITSDGELIDLSEQMRKELKIKFESIPSFMPKRWMLRYIQQFLDGKNRKVDPKKLHEKIEIQYKKYLAIRNNTWYKIHALWDIGTYIYQTFEAYPFIELRGIPGTAKTKSMTVSSYISFNGGQIMVNPSEATLFREKDEIRGTSYFDEAEKLWVFNKSTKQWEGDVRTELINASYTKEAKVPRQERIGNGRFFTKWYSPYGPTQLGSVTGLHGATETRAITRITTKSPDDDERGENEPTEDRKLPIWEEIRDECYRFGLTYWKDIQTIYLDFPKDTGLKRRDLQIWKPLLSIAKFISEDLFIEIVEFAKEMTQRRTDDLLPESSFDYGILEALKTCLERSNSINKVYINDIKIAFCNKQNNPEGIEDKYLNRNISSHLDKLGFKELRGRDNRAAYFEVTREIYQGIVAPICPTLAFPSTSSPLSTSSTPKSDIEVVKVVINGENGDSNKEKDDGIDFSRSNIKEILENG